MFRPQLLSLVLLVALPMGVFASGVDQESLAYALFCGATQKILSFESFRVCYTETRAEEDRTVSQIVDYDHGKMRKDHLRNGDFEGWVAVRNENDCCTFRFADGEDARLDSIKSDNAAMSGLYDPRVLFLGDIPFYKFTVDRRLPQVRIKGARVEDDIVDGKPVKKISTTNDGGTWTHWISEPEFHVVKVTHESKRARDDPFSVCLATTSKYDDLTLGPFPSEIHIIREEGGKVVKNRTIKVTSFEIKDSFPPDTFTYKSMNLPLNTAVVDYRIHRRLGYWDGEKLVDAPVRISAQELRELMEKPSFGIVRVLLIGIGGLMIALALFFMVRKKLRVKM